MMDRFEGLQKRKKIIKKKKKKKTQRKAVLSMKKRVSAVAGIAVTMLNIMGNLDVFNDWFLSKGVALGGKVLFFLFFFFSSLERKEDPSLASSLNFLIFHFMRRLLLAAFLSHSIGCPVKLRHVH
jgi:hypothetical protein